MLLSVICPVYNEKAHIDQLVSFFLQSNPAEKELLLIDGGSTDGTLDHILKLTREHPNIQLILNPEKYVPFALNLAIPKCRGKYIVRLDAHTEYAPDYFEKILETFQETNADIVGGPTGVKGLSAFQSAVAHAITTPFGIGNSKVHDLNYRGYTDSVTFGAWKKEIFEVTGLFDAQLIRNQDDEFHYRAKSKGMKIFQNPEIKLFYLPRHTPRALFSQYFQYGYYKPLVLKKVPTGIQLRHLIPAGFVLYGMLAPITALVGWLYLIPLVVYTGIDLLSSFQPNNQGLKPKLLCTMVYPIIHIAYGMGFLAGLFKKTS